MVRLGELARALGGKLIGAPGAASQPVARVVADSRLAASGDLFVAIRGARVDGNDFIPRAATAGAVGVLADREPSAPPPLPLILVPDAHAAEPTAAMLVHGAAVAEIALVGVKGTNGKTTVAHMLKA